MGHVFVTRRVPGRAIDLLEEAGHDVTLWPGDFPPDPDSLREGVRDADAALTLVTDPVDTALLDSAPGLRVVANMAVGYDNVDAEAAAAAGVWATNTPGVLHETTADLAFALLLAAARNVVLSERDTRDGGWQTWSPTGFLGHDPHGATLGIVGLGEIGRAVARRARGFGMTVLTATRTPRPEVEQELGVERVSLPELLARSDFVTLHVPYGPETEGLMGAAEFAAMKETAILVNTSRGGVVDQDALVEALRAGAIGGAALDVTVPEPLPLDHALFAFSNVVITPHIGSASHATRARMAEMAARNIIAVLAGEEPPNPVNLSIIENSEPTPQEP
ncbi:MAG: D-glycerate dehydrogenase, partial [Dehalococcoidia bacterium]|nr:D-glycerate dehydrogenase [Dehalococcoidia bacterium]